jgi:hypothetical protein
MNTKQIDQKFEKRKTTHLIISILIDVLGMATYLLPLVGELVDVFYAPLAGIIIFLMYRRDMKVGIIGALFGTAEELFIADLIPTATLLWVYTYVVNKKKTYNAFILEHKKTLD